MASFKEAFAKARKEKGPGKTFKWKGDSYSTNYEGEAKKKTESSPRPKARASAKDEKPKSSPRPKTRSSSSKTSPRPQARPTKKTTVTVKKETPAKTSSKPDSKSKSTPKGGVSDRQGKAKYGGISDRERTGTKGKSLIKMVGRALDRASERRKTDYKNRPGRGNTNR